MEIKTTGDGKRKIFKKISQEQERYRPSKKLKFKSNVTDSFYE